jgi:hypothetical protein
MKEIWRKTFELFRWHPILWLPYVFAQLLAGYQWRMRTLVAERIYDWLLANRSVFGYYSAFGFFVESPNSENSSLNLALIVNVPVGFTTQLLYLSLFVTAFVVTSTMVEVIRSGKEPDLMASVSMSVRRWRSILRFTLKVYMFGVIASVATVIFALVPVTSDSGDFPFSEYQLLLYQIAAVAIAAWFLIPGALGLLQSSELRPIDTNTRRQGVLLAILAVASTFAVGLIVNRILGSTEFDTQRDLFLVVAASEVLMNSAIAPLFIALSLLALKAPDDSKLEA